MGTGNNEVGKDIPISVTPISDTPVRSSERPAMTTARSGKKCQGAMSQQGYGAHGNECYPQKLVQLVGYRGPQSKESWDRLRRSVTRQSAE